MVNISFVSNYVGYCSLLKNTSVNIRNLSQCAVVLLQSNSSASMATFIGINILVIAILRKATQYFNPSQTKIRTVITCLGAGVCSAAFNILLSQNAVYRVSHVAITTFAVITAAACFINNGRTSDNVKEQMLAPLCEKENKREEQEQSSDVSVEFHKFQILSPISERKENDSFSLDSNTPLTDPRNKPIKNYQ